MFGFGKKEKEPTFGEMVNSPEVPLPPKLERTEAMTAEDRAELASKKYEQASAWASEKVNSAKEKASALWGGLKNRFKKGVGYALAAPEIGANLAAQANERVSNTLIAAGNVDYDRNIRPDGGKMENFLAGLDEARDKLGSQISGGAETVKQDFGRFKEFMHSTLENTGGIAYSAAEKLDKKLNMGTEFVAKRTESAYKRFTEFVKYHSPAQRRERSEQAIKKPFIDRLEKLKADLDVSEKAVVSVDPERLSEITKLLLACAEHNIPVPTLKIEVGYDASEKYQTHQAGSAERAAA